MKINVLIFIWHKLDKISININCQINYFPSKMSLSKLEKHYIKLCLTLFKIIWIFHFLKRDFTHSKVTENILRRTEFCCSDKTVTVFIANIINKLTEANCSNYFVIVITTNQPTKKFNHNYYRLIKSTKLLCWL